MTSNFDKFYQAYMAYYGAEEGDRESLLEALETHDYSKVPRMMLTAYALWGEAFHSADVWPYMTSKRQFSKQDALESALDKRKNLALDILEDADVMSEFDSTVWVAITKEMWEEFNK